jgi:hypothetical protein
VKIKNDTDNSLHLNDQTIYFFIGDVQKRRAGLPYSNEEFIKIVRRIRTEINLCLKIFVDILDYSGLNTPAAVF